jgi:toxin ParE1/3/4
VAREILLAGESLLLFPRRGRLGMAPETRELLAVIPYVIVYEVVDGEVFILRAWHGAQDR